MSYPRSPRPVCSTTIGTKKLFINIRSLVPQPTGGGIRGQAHAQELLSSKSLHASPNLNESAGELSGPFGHPPIQLLGVKPFSALNFLRMQFKRSLRLATINPNMFLVGGRAGCQLEEPARSGAQSQADLFAHLPHGASIVTLTRVQVTGSRRIPQTWLPILFH